jgi:hypothetical protein
MLSVSKACALSSFSALINAFPDIIGMLETETTVEGRIPAPQAPLSWFRMNPPYFEREEGGEIENWREPILDLWDFPGTRIHIRRNDP